MTEIIEKIKDIVGDVGILTGNDVSQRAEDWQGRGSCKAMVRPATTEEISKLKKNIQHQYGEPVVIIAFGHLGDGNLHLMISVPNDSATIHKQVNEFVYKPLQEIGGSISAEHGIGLEKRDYLKYSRSEEEIKLMEQLKNMLDPKNILNKHKVLGTK